MKTTDSKEDTLDILDTPEGKLEAFKSLAHKCKTKKKILKHTLIEPYKQEIYQLRFEKNLSYAEISRLFEQIKEKISKNAVVRFCREAFPLEYRRYSKRTKKVKAFKVEKKKKPVEELALKEKD